MIAGVRFFFSTSVRHGLLAIAVIITPFLPSQAESLRIGLSGPFSGGSSPMGESMRNGVRLAVEEINSSGGILGLPVELVERDDMASNE